MACYIGIDIGAVSATAALLIEGGQDVHVDGFTPLGQQAGPHGRLYLSEYHRTKGKPLAAATEMLEQVLAAVGAANVKGVCLTGSGAKLAAAKLGATLVNEFKAIASGLAELNINARTVFEMGGESSKYLRLTRDGEVFHIVDYATNGDCAAGTGSFIDQQAGRLKYAIEDVGKLCDDAQRAAQVAGRCSVFAKSDMIHAQQKGYSPAEVLRGLCNAVARNFRSAVVKSHPIEAPVVMLGGVMANSAVVRAMREAFELDESQMIIPAAYAHVPAIGAAALAAGSTHAADLARMADLRAASDSAHGVFPTQEPLSMDNVLLLRDRVRPTPPPPGTSKIDVYLGIDIGSVSTNVVAIDTDGKLLIEVYVRTKGRPVQVVTEALANVHKEWGDRLNVLGVGTTGSGRELIGELVGADTINDEITAHKMGATFVGQTMLDGRVPDTIFEIGGQDSKYISLQDGVVVDFTMNEACAAGTGSFLEERAEELDISIIGQFARMALSSEAPIRLGERCTVFMERDVNSYLQRGANKADLVAGLAYSVAYNYINRVVRDRPVGECIFFQGGTAYNDAVAAAFSCVLGKQIVVPPHNGVIGAIGSALLARDKMTAGEAVSAARGVQEIGSYISQQGGEAPVHHSRATLHVAASRFRGYDMSKVDHKLREFTCKGCSNQCQIQEFDVEGEKTYWGDKCSDRFRKRVKSAQKPVIDDLVSFRMKQLLDDSALPKVEGNARTVGIPLTMFAMEQLPFWRTLLAGCGFKTVLSDPTNKKICQAGLDSVVAEPCHPIIVAHGHVVNLIEKGVDRILMPNIVSLATQWMGCESHLCPWHQTMPFVIRRAAGIEEHMDKFITPTIHFRDGAGVVLKELQQALLPLGVDKKRLAASLEQAYAAQQAFGATLRAEGAKALAVLEDTKAPGIVLIGRPYNIHDAGMNLSVAQKLRDYYGANCLPLDVLDVNDIDITDINDNMFWDLGRRILAAAKLVGRHENLHIIYITNFKCGPDSFIKHFIRQASGKPFLSLQFDGHSNDAGMMTRCEAYLDSKGILRPWRKERIHVQPKREEVEVSLL